jgi:UDP-N-acetylglucosamine diphosphorylase/glucosamine-1-phosphate N-acetyltransferase
MNLIFFEPYRNNLLPFTFTRPSSDIRIGISTITEKWKLAFNSNVVNYSTADYLQSKFCLKIESQNLLINGHLIPNDDLVRQIENLEVNTALVQNGEILAVSADEHFSQSFLNGDNTLLKQVEYLGNILLIKNIWEIFSKNGEVLNYDFEKITAGRTSEPWSKTNTVIGPSNKLFIEKGAKIEASVLNTNDGPIYIGIDSEIMEGCLVRGPFALGEHSTLKLGAKIYGATTFGPQVKVGGEVNNSVIFGYSSKAHDGFLGNSVLGEWCNLGADTNNSNLKNNYANVKLWNYNKGGFVDTGLQFCGLFMGDHSKCAINTMFNTGTVVGVSANIFGSGFPRNFIPSFSWGGAQGLSTYKVEQAIQTAKLVYERRKIEFSKSDESLFKHLFELTSSNRNY